MLLWPESEDEVSSESDFEPEKVPQVQDGDQDAEGDEDDALQPDDLEEDVPEAPPVSAPSKPKKSSAKAKGKAKSEGPTHTSVGPPTARRQMYALPTPSVHHRHRAVPLYSRSGRVERLTSRPSMFGTPSSVLTNGLTENSKISDRVNKSWGYNVGSGPLWDLAEDRGWYKEAVRTGDGVDMESKRRPRVYEDIRIVDELGVLLLGGAAPYLPTDDVTTEEGNLKPPPPVPCYFGSIKNQTRLDVQMFESFPMSSFAPESNGLVFNAGAPVWGLDWCPIHVDDREARSFKQYLAVAPFPSHSHSPDIGRKVARPSYACIQIWSLSRSTKRNPASNGTNAAGHDRGEMRCEMVLCLDTGPAYELKWCPLPSHDMITDTIGHKKLGLLAGTFQDGSFSVFVVPDPSEVVPAGSDPAQPVCVRLPHPILRIELPETACWSFDWANSELIAIGTTNGIIAIYNVGPSLKAHTDPSLPTITNLLPTHYLFVHQSAVRALAWIKAPAYSPAGESCVDQDPTVVASAGYDGMECLTDIREGRGSVMNRTRDVINALVFSPFAGGPITMDHENTVKAYSASPSMLGRGHSLFEPQGPSVHASDYHPQLAVGASDGSCSTTNLLRSTRRGGSVPFFVHKIFQMDYSRNTKEYRMLDRFLPQESFDRPTATRASKGKKDKKDEPEYPSSTGAWPREVGVHRVVWNNGNGLASCALLAAATSSGLCRVDVLWGRWVKDKVPYGGVEGIRMEEMDPDAMEVDSDEDEDEDDDE
ncbi:hypothetical protein CPB84DRAFT_1841910 [Gymnopilus junonius]|uniref:Uncharacterized protein n=1 Tax=Gymnopilus junonius TaxID=109634 RepID=A0A9P5TU17_GYMJU|nr:hypothetical protein CPB84DRAFT_1841910 [Gymnopilus junonius]